MLARDEKGRVQDHDAIQLLMHYALEPDKIQSEMNYLDGLKNDAGESFARSKGKFSDIEEQVASFEAQEKPSFQWNQHYQAALRKVMERYAPAHLRMIEYSSDKDIYEAVTDWSTSAGWSGILNEGRNKKKHYLRDIYPTLLEKEAEAKTNGSFQTPIVCWFRTQGSGAYDELGNHTNTWKSKKRLVFIDDLYSVASGRRFIAPLTEFMKNYEFTAVGKDDYWISSWVNAYRLKGWNFISLDYSKYDSTIPSWLIHDAFRVIRSAFYQFDEELLSVLESDFIHKNVFTGDGLHHFDHGNVSGSAFTTVVNCICNEIITETWLSYLGWTAKYNIMGDDNLIYISRNVDERLVASIGSYIVHNFGVKVNPDKSSFGTAKDYPEYLSRIWKPSGAWRCTGEVIAHLWFPEKKRKYEQDLLTPALVLYSYILSVPSSMREIMDVAKFERDYRLSFSEIEWTKEMREAVPYNVRLAVESGRSFVASKREYWETNREALLA
jgi:hypothetical protein